MRGQPQLDAEASVELSRVLGVLAHEAGAVLGDMLIGVYLTGSFALGCADSASDIDFLVVSSRELTPVHEDAARRVHRLLPDRPEHWAHHLDGSWVSAAALRDPPGAHGPWLYVDNGSRTMEHSHHDDTCNVRWVMRHSGIAVVGPPATSLLPVVTPSELRAEAAAQANNRAAWIDSQPEALLDAWAQPYAVLTHCRLLWTATSGTVIGKVAGAEWVRETQAPREFTDLLTDAIAGRLRFAERSAVELSPRSTAATTSFVAWATREIHSRVGTIERE